jgi:hypothetical protein
MAFLKRLFGKAEEPRARVRVCVECGMPVAEHKTWCSILQGELEMKNRIEARQASGNRPEGQPDAARSVQ